MQYLHDLLSDDLPTINSMIAPGRTYCPKIIRSIQSDAVEILGPGDRWIAHVVRDGNTWHVRVADSKGGTTSTESTVVVVRNGTRYFVC